MRPKKPAEESSGDLFRARLDQIIDMGHELEHFLITPSRIRQRRSSFGIRLA